MYLFSYLVAYITMVWTHGSGRIVQGGENKAFRYRGHDMSSHQEEHPTAHRQPAYPDDGSGIVAESVSTLSDGQAVIGNLATLSSSGPISSSKPGCSSWYLTHATATDL